MSVLVSLGLFLVVMAVCGAVLGMCFDVVRDQRAPAWVRISFGIMAAGLLLIVAAGIGSMFSGGAS